MADHYEVLQVHPRADPEVIRAAFRTLARKYHPDFGGDQRQMMALNDAWNVLGDRARRAAYDASRGGAGLRPAASQPKSARVENAPASTARPEEPPIAARGPLAAAAARKARNGGAPPPAHQSGTVLDFGRYAGWTVGDLAQHDPDYLLWLERTPIGRPIRAEIRVHLERGSATATATAQRPRTSLLRRRPR